MNKPAGSVSVLAILVLLAGMGGTTSLHPGASYRVTVSKVESNGALTEYAHVGAVAADDGTISFAAPAPSRNESNFVVITVIDATGAMVRRSIGAAAPSGSIAAVGVTAVTTVRSEGILAAFRDSGSDDPLLAAYGAVLFRSPSLSPDEVAALSGILRSAAAWFAGSLPQNRLAAWRAALLENPAGVDLGDVFAEMKAAAGLASGSDAAMARTSGRVADLFADAARAAGIPLDLVLDAHDATLARAGNALASAPLGDEVRQSIGRSLDVFTSRLGALKSLLEYAAAMDVLVIPSNEQEEFRAILATTRASLDAMEGLPGAGPEQARQIFENSDLTDRASGTAVAGLIDSYARTLGVALPRSVLEDWGFGGYPINATIPRLCLFRWFETMLRAGQVFTYTRMTSFPTATRSTTFATGNESLKAFLGLLEDLRIVQWAYQTDAPALSASSRAEFRIQIEAVKTEIVQGMQFSNGLYPGPFPDSPERAIVALMLQPSMD